MATEFLRALMREDLKLAGWWLAACPALLNYNGYLWGETALHYVGTEGRAKAVEWLIHKGADLDASRDSDGTTLGSAAGLGHASVVRVLLRHGARTDIQDRSLGAPLHRAATNGEIEVMRMLLAAGANPNIRDDMGDTPLHDLSEKKCELGIPLLLRHGARLEGRASFWATPLMAAVTMDKYSKARCLLQHGAKLRTFGNSGDDGTISPLHWAVWNRNARMTRLLLAAGADPNARTTTGKLPGEWRARKPPLEIARMLDRARNRVLH